MTGSAKQSNYLPEERMDCFVARAPRNDGDREADYRPPSGPITTLGRPVEISGKKQSSSTASIISSTNGSVPQITSLRGMSGATLRMTKIFRPTGGWISPISITMVMTAPNQKRSQFAGRKGGRMNGAGIRIIDTRGGERARPNTPTRNPDSEFR